MSVRRQAPTRAIQHVGRQVTPSHVMAASYPSPSSSTDRARADLSSNRAQMNAREDGTDAVPLYRRAGARKRRDVIQVEESPPPAPVPALQTPARLTGRTRVKVEDPPDEIGLLPSHALPEPRCRAAPGEDIRDAARDTLELARAPPPPELSALEHFFTQTCQPPLPEAKVREMIEIFESLGVQTQEELVILSVTTDAARENWFKQARGKGLSMLWESIMIGSLKEMTRAAG